MISSPWFSPVRISVSVAPVIPVVTCRKTALPPARLAELVGYKNTAYFSRVFQAYEARRSPKP